MPSPASFSASTASRLLAVVALSCAAVACGHDWSSADTTGDGSVDGTDEDTALPDSDDAASEDAAVDDGLFDDAVLDDAGPADVPRCEPVGDQRCLDGRLEQCMTGGWSVLWSCPLGCHSAGLRCRVFDPLNLEPERLLGETEDLVLPEGVAVVYDTTACEPLWTAEAELVGAGGEAVYCLVTVGELQLGGDVRVRGEYPLILLALGSVELLGSVDVSAVGTVPGPGGGRGGAVAGSAGDGVGAGGGGGHYGTYHDGGGGGGAGGGAGGPGGEGGPRYTAAGGTAGLPFDSATPGEPLLGGGGGGAGGGLGAGGGGGGALQIVARDAINVGGRMLAGGGGGGAGEIEGSANWGAGGGGGGGGTIVLEAPMVRLAGGSLVANGGGGGGGVGTIGSTCSDSPLPGQPGQDGPASSSGGSGGTAAAPCGGVGGAGGGQADGAGAAGENANDNGGGGGGGPGLVVVRILDGSFPYEGLISPLSDGCFVVGTLDLED